MKRKRQHILMNGFEFKERTYYVVEVSLFHGNPIFQDIFYTGFLNGGNGYPGGYNKFFNSDKEFKDVSYIKIIREIDTSIDNENKTVRNVLEKTHPEKLI